MSEYFVSTTHQKSVTFEEKVRYIKDHLHLTVAPVGEHYTKEMIDRMYDDAKYRWSDGGWQSHEWLEGLYSNMKELRK